MERIDPATGDALEPVPDTSEEEIDAALDRVAETFETWRERPIGERQRLLAAAADVLRENTEEYAELMTREMGKPISGARSEVEKCAWVCEIGRAHV